MKEKFRRAWYLYQRFWLYAGMGHGEIQKPMMPISIISLLLILLKEYNVSVTLKVMIALYVFAIFLAFTVGWFFMKWRGLELSQQFSNEQNPQIKEILEKVTQINNRLNG